MIGQKKDSKRDNKVQTLIGQGTEIRGDIVFDGGLFIDGSVIGDIKAKTDSPSSINLSNTGRIEGKIQAAHITLNGTVIGDAHALERIELSNSAKVTGNIHYRLIEMVAGAEINGQLVNEAVAQSEAVDIDRASPAFAVPDTKSIK